MNLNDPVVHVAQGSLRGVWRGASAAFYGIPFAEEPVGEVRFGAPVAASQWQGIRDATHPGPTPQRRPIADVTTIPEPSFPGESTLNVNVFTPAPGDETAQLPVLVWIHGGGFFAGSPSSPWYDGRAFNRDGVVTVSVSYRLGFDGFGWIEDAPTNRGLLDQIAALTWVRDNIAAFGGDAGRVTIAGQSAGGASAMALLASPPAQPLFSQVIAHSAAALAHTLDDGTRAGREFARVAGVEPTRAGWSALSEERILDLQAAFMAPQGEGPATASDVVRMNLGSGAIDLPFVPLIGDHLLPWSIEEALARGIGADKRLVAGTVAHEFTMMGMGLRDAFAGTDAVEALVAGGLPRGAASGYVQNQPELRWTADVCGQLVTDLAFRLPTVRWADRRPEHTWVYDFRWPAPGLGMSVHCLELPFAWDLLDAEGVAAVAGDGPPQELADAMHTAWVHFITHGDPGWAPWDGANARVFGGEPGDHYATSRLLDRHA